MRKQIDRRTFLGLLGLAAVAPAGAGEDEALWLGARLAAGGGFEVAVIDARGRDRLVLPLEARGHSFAIDAPRRRAVAFARAPGRFAVAFGIDGGTPPFAIAAAEGRHFFGHGVFTADGRLMLASESDYEAGQGVTGVYDVAAGFRRIGEFSTGGIGPHEIVLMGDGRTLCIANGGILTHPDYERLKLNLDAMKPSIAYIDVASGELVEQVFLAEALHRLSIRHMALDAAGDIWFGCQWEGEPGERPPLVGRHRRGREPELFPGPAATLRGLDNYVGALAVDASGGVVATSSPRGGIIAFWDAATGRHLGDRELADGCGVAPMGEGLVLASSGRGALAELSAQGEREIVAARPAPSWDNHLRRV
ncbi:MAG: DUF1513 domain-containing protein [Rhizobiaceae bacterium]|nr:DUF1513 domain-containing protein [Rhizobiaceae bacterium]